MDTEFKHIVCDADGLAWIEGSQLKVLELVMACQAYGWSPEEYHLQHPVVSLAKICSVLAYYYENQTELDGQILADVEWAELERQRNLVETAKLRNRVQRMRQKSA